MQGQRLEHGGQRLPYGFSYGQRGQTFMGTGDCMEQSNVLQGGCLDRTILNSSQIATGGDGFEMGIVSAYVPTTAKRIYGGS